MRNPKNLMVRITLLALYLSGCGGSGDQEAAVNPNAIDPGPYRAQIQAVESILYKESPPELFDCDRVARAMMDLHEMIVDTETNRVAVHEANRILFLSSRADIGDVGYAIPDLGPIRKEWEEVRSVVFAPADWFRTGGVEIAHAQTPPLPKADRRDVSALTRVIERLEAVIEDGRKDVEDLGEPVYSAERLGAEGRRQIAAWRQWASEWDEELDGIASRLPGQPAWSGEQNYVLAYQDVGGALHQLRLVPVGVGIWETPFRYQWDMRFSSAESCLGRARQYLENTHQ